MRLPVWALLLTQPVACSKPDPEPSDTTPDPTSEPAHPTDTHSSGGTSDSGTSRDTATTDTGSDCVELEAETLEVDIPGFDDRKVTVHIPAHPCGPLPAVMALHGGGHNKEKMEQITCPGDDPDSPPSDLFASGCLNAVAADRGYVVLYPNGTERFLEIRTFNAGGGADGYECVSGYACDQQVDDVAYFGAVLDELSSHPSVDMERVYVLGASNGAAMAHRLGCELADRFAGIGSGGAGNQFAATDTCSPSRALPILMIHGDADPIWPYLGGKGGLLGQDNQVGLPMTVNVGPSTTAGWVDRNGCETGPTSTTLADSVSEDTWTDCTDAADVSLITIAGGGHTWPGGWKQADNVGEVNREVNASELFLDFFTEH